MQIHQDQTPIFSKFNNEFWYFRQFSIEISWPQMLSCETFEFKKKLKKKEEEEEEEARVILVKSKSNFHYFGYNKNRK